MDLITGKGPSKRHEIFYFTETTLSAVRLDDFKYRFTDQPNGWLGATVKVDWPILTNLRLDPYERTGMYNGKDNGSISYYNWFVNEFWRFVFVQQEVAKQPNRSSTIRRCRRARASTWRRSRSKFRKPCTRIPASSAVSGVGQANGAPARRATPPSPRKGGRARAQLNSKSAAARCGCRAWATSALRIGLAGVLVRNRAGISELRELRGQSMCLTRRGQSTIMSLMCCPRNAAAFPKPPPAC